MKKISKNPITKLSILTALLLVVAVSFAQEKNNLTLYSFYVMT
ncbi:hypothetical protein ADIARSV_4163 [Arcticibacter svalbardensis MN12-7]|uniref:Uncharacterized protein n=1 Tax=Arcticibacter svalbardensis MN12-7 TaxID=1150600 RepID=R9GLV0_9SPHI|nr:hypothetical protein ADIARSV_4163 [Arcticibacter svalbardensis MN12-7]